jgi:dephospho-CoA kinase
MNRLIGITGNIASGKSMALNYLGSKGYMTFNADDVVRELYLDEEVMEGVRKLFPSGLTPGSREFPKTLGSSPRETFARKIADIIYKDEVKRRELEKLIHPLVEEKLMLFASSIKDEEMGFAEVPLLFEAKMEKFFDYTILIYCDRDVRMQRAKDRGLEEKKFDMIDKVQMSDELKKERVDFMIDSDVGIVEFEDRIDKVIERIIK